MWSVTFRRLTHISTITCAHKAVVLQNVVPKLPKSRATSQNPTARNGPQPPSLRSKLGPSVWFKLLWNVAISSSHQPHISALSVGAERDRQSFASRCALIQSGAQILQW